MALENALMGHPAVAEAAVIPAAHPKWAERPLAIVVLKKERTATPQELIDFIEPQFAKWWLPDAVEFASEIPRTSAGKFLKTALREKYGDYYARRRQLTPAIHRLASLIASACLRSHQHPLSERFARSPTMPQPVVIEAVRTPFGRKGGAFREIRPDSLLAGALAGLVRAGQACRRPRSKTS